MDAASTLAYLSGVLDQGFRREMRRRLADHDMSVPEYTVLSVIECRPGLSNAELARRSLMRPQSMNVVVEALDRRGLIERQGDPSHARILQVRVTAAGRELVARVRPIVDELQDEVFQEVTDADRLIVSRSLAAGIQRLVEMERD